MNLIIIIIIVAFVISLFQIDRKVNKLRKKVREVLLNQAWEGTLVDKTQKSPNKYVTYYYISVKLKDDSTRKARINKEIWQSLSVGDKLIKHPGELDIAKINPA